MPDTEQNNPSIANPYTDNGPPPMPSWADKLTRLIYLSISVFALTYFNFFKVLLKSPHIRHGWFQIGLALTIGT